MAKRPAIHMTQKTSRFRNYDGRSGFNFIPIPVTPDLKSISPAGKILYSLMLYRMQLSKSRPEWIDENGEPFIYYSLKDVMNDISCGEKKALQLFKELEEAHLIRRHSQCQFSTPRIYISTNRSDEA